MTGTEELRQKKVDEKLEHTLRLVEKRDKFLIKDRSADRAVLEEVFDRSTLMVIYDLMNMGKIDRLHGVVSTGKEARIYWAIDKNGCEIAVKIYLTVSAEFRRGKMIYIEGDPRFRNVRRNSRAITYLWAQREFKNLKAAYNADVPVPKPILVTKNVLLMEFVGKNGKPAPTMKEKPPSRPKKVYEMLLSHIKKLYKKAELVHGDLSEYNIMIWRGKPIIFDLSQAIPLKHPMATQFLRRDIMNLNKYFRLLGVKVMSSEDAYRWVTEDG